MTLMAQIWRVLQKRNLGELVCITHHVSCMSYVSRMNGMLRAVRCMSVASINYHTLLCSKRVHVGPPWVLWLDCRPLAGHARKHARRKPASLPRLFQMGSTQTSGRSASRPRSASYQSWRGESCCLGTLPPARGKGTTVHKGRRDVYIRKLDLSCDEL